MIRAVIFDFGGVVVSEGFEIWQQEYIPNRDLIKQDVMFASPRVDRGTISITGYTEIFAQAAGKSIDEVNKEVLAEYELHLDVMAVVRKLRKNELKTGIIANFPQEWFDPLFTKFHLQEFFDSVIVSSKVGIVKPEAGIFEEALRELGVAPEEAVFVDDQRVNIDGAEDIGLHGIVYTDTMSLLHDLAQLDIRLSF